MILERIDNMSKSETSIASVNSWNILCDYFENDKEIKPYFDKIHEEFLRSDSHSMPNMMIFTVRLLLDKISSLEDEIKEYEMSVIK
jgi:hypothetical protein